MPVKTFCHRCGKEMSSALALEPNIDTGRAKYHVCDTCLVGITGFILCTFEENTIKNTMPCKECSARGFVYKQETPDAKD